MGVDQLVGITRVAGGSGNDMIIGSSEANRFSGGEGDDNIDGGQGGDWAEYDQGGPVNVDLAAGTATGQGSDTLTSIEHVLGSWAMTRWRAMRRPTGWRAMRVTIRSLVPAVRTY